MFVAVVVLTVVTAYLSPGFYRVLFVPENAVLILESRVGEPEIDREIEKVELLFSAGPAREKALRFSTLAQPFTELVVR